MIPEPFDRIVKKNAHYLSTITDENLSKYFVECFNGIVEELGLYACWICVKCMEKNILSYGWGERPATCPKCGKPSTYMIGTFQAWASKTGDMFEWAFYYLMVNRMKMPLIKSSATSETHDFEVPDKIGIEAKGSATYVRNPNGSVYLLKRAGMLRSDTKKKAFSNAKEFKRKKIGPFFYIVTNAMPDEFIGYKDRDIDGIYDITKVAQLEEFVKEIRSKKAQDLSWFT